MKTLYLDLFSGISGDMFVAALLDLGADAHLLQAELDKLGLGEFHLRISRQARGGISGTKFDVELEHADEHRHEHEHEHAHAHDHGHSHGHTHDHGHSHEAHAQPAHDHGRNFADIRRLITGSTLSDWVKLRVVAVFHRIAVAEGKIHGHPPEEVHFHEVGAVDSIVDIVAACVALDFLGRPRVLASQVVEGTGWVHCAHGRFPIPAPATLEILAARGVALTQCEEPHELVTPTGAALLAEFVERFGPMTGLVPARIGYGIGTRENHTRPNVLRAVLADATATRHDWEVDTVAVLQTNLDDINPEILGRFLKTAFTAGALDVFHTPVQMKKNRPGVLLTVMCAEAESEKFMELILRETSAFGVRRHVAERRKLRREFRSVSTLYGEVEVKLGLLDGRIVQAAPEFESCKRLATLTGAPLKQVYEAALRVLPSQS